MNKPTWLYYLFGALMLAVAAYCASLLVLSVATNRRVGRDVEISHVFMGVAMAGMFVGQWAFGPSGLWELIFGALLVWFLVESIQSILRYGLHLSHALIHVVMNFAMLLMYWFPMGSSSAAGSMSMSSTGGAKLDPGLAFFVAFALFASAVFTLASPNKGGSHFGSHVPPFVLAAAAASTTRAHDQKGEQSVAVVLDEVVATPWLVDVSHVVMCLAMGFMLLLMI